MIKLASDCTQRARFPWISLYSSLFDLDFCPSEVLYEMLLEKNKSASLRIFIEPEETVLSKERRMSGIL